MTKLLDGIRVIDFTMWLQGPVAGQLLADLGAEVIHLENPESGDGGRGLVRVGKSMYMNVGGWNSYFDNNNRGKKGLALDLRKESGRKILYKLVEKSDVFLCNVMGVARWGLDYKTLSRINPRLIYATSSGYGPFGPGVSRPAFDPNVQGRTGIMAQLGEPGTPPVYTGLGSGDITGALLTAWGIMLALYHRERTGQGQELETSLLSAQLTFSAPTLQAYLATGSDYYLQQHSRKEAPNPLRNVYRVKDKWIFLCMRNSEQFWHSFCKGLGIEQLEHDPRFDTPEKRGKNSSQLIAILDEIFPQRTAAQWMERWQGLGLIASPINNLAELSVDPQAWENRYIIDIYHPAAERQVAMRGFPVHFSKTPGEAKAPGPELGQHTEEILVDLLGYTWDQIAQFKEEKAII